MATREQELPPVSGVLGDCRRERALDHNPPSGSRSKRLSVVVLGTLAVAVLVAATAWTLVPRASRASGPGGPHLSIAVVPPVERVPMAGDVLDVGTLNDAFDRAALDRRPQVADADDLPPEAYAGETWSDPPAPPQRTMSRPVAPTSDVAIVTSTDPLADGSRLFGFDRAPVVPAPTEGAAPPSDARLGSPTFFQ